MTWRRWLKWTGIAGLVGYIAALFVNTTSTLGYTYVALWILFFGLSPVWHPQIQLDIINRTGSDIDVDGSLLRLAPHIPDLGGDEQEVVQRVWPTMTEQIDQRFLGFYIVWVKRRDSAVTIAYRQVEDGPTVTWRVPIENKPFYWPCRFQITIYPDRAEASKCKGHYDSIYDGYGYPPFLWE